MSENFPSWLMSMSRESRIMTPRRSKRRRWKGQSVCPVVLFQILLAQSLIIRGLVLGWTLPRLSSPSYTREYAYWKKADISTCAEEDEKKESLTYTQAFRRNGVERPPWKVPPFFWKWAYRVQLKVLPILHAFDDSANRIPNSSLSLPILWWKALMRRTNPSAAEWAYDLLPGRTRWIVRVFHRFFPPLHHVNIQLRTTFLDNRTMTIANQIRSSKPDAKVRLVVLGAGYDLRSLRFLQEGIVDEAIELDLPNVIAAKKTLLESSTFQHRRPSCELPTMAGANLNDIETTNATLCELLQPTNQAQDHIYTIFLLEGILVHLGSGSSSKILQLLHSYCEGSNNNNSNGCLVFCDRIQGVNNRSLDLARTVLHEAGWQLTEFLATPTKTPHFGVAFPTDTVL